VTVIDSHILDYFLNAMDAGDIELASNPELREQEIAIFRLFLWVDFGIGRVAAEEVQQIPNQQRRERLQRIIDIQLPEVCVQEEDLDRWRLRAVELEQHHAGKRDCELVAEAEVVGASTFLSYDKDLVRRLKPHARVNVRFPTEHWDAIAIPRGTPSKWKPAPENPLANATFWRWDKQLSTGG
jgi:hypothetical protein